MEKKEYGLVHEDGTFVVSYGYYGNSPAILLYTKAEAKKYIDSFDKTLRAEKLKIADSNNNALYGKKED